MSDLCRDAEIVDASRDSDDGENERIARQGWYAFVHLLHHSWRWFTLIAVVLAVRLRTITAAGFARAIRTMDGIGFFSLHPLLTIRRKVSNVTIEHERTSSLELVVFLIELAAFSNNR